MRVFWITNVLAFCNFLMLLVFDWGLSVKWQQLTSETTPRVNTEPIVCVRVSCQDE